MSFFTRSEPYTPVIRRSGKKQPLTPEQAKHILENPYPTGYTYANSASYSVNNPKEYINPNLSRSFLSSSTSSSFSNTSGAQHCSNKDEENKRRCFWSLMIGLICLLLLLWRVYPQKHSLASAQTCLRIDTAKDVLHSQEKLQCSLNEKGCGKNVTSNEQSSAKRNRWENELDKLRKEVHSLTEISHKADKNRIAAMDEQMNKLKHLIDDLFEAERQMIRDEQEQLRKIIEEQNHLSHQQVSHVSEEEVAKLVHDSIMKLDLSSVVEETVRSHVKTELSEVEQHSMEIIEKNIQRTISAALKKYYYDKTGEADFALESAGGTVLTTRGTKEYHPLHRRETLYGVPLWFNSCKARILIQRQSQNVNAGECWGVEGSEGNVVIKLAEKISVTAISYEHLPRELSISGNIDSAPKMFNVYSLQDENDLDKVLIGKYTFDAEAEPLQRFVAERNDPRGTPIIEFELLSNYGAPFTCLYRFRVHGKPL